MNILHLQNQILNRLGLAIIALFIMACEDPDPIDYTPSDNNVHTPIAEELKVLMFKPGSYWIYKNDLSDAIDSIYVESNYDGWYGYGGDHGSQSYTFDTYTTQYKRSFNNDSYNHLFMRKSIHWNGPFPDGHGFYGIDLHLGLNWGANDAGFRVLAINPMISVNGNEFHQVFEIFIKDWGGSHMTPLGHNMILFMDDSVGIIKRIDNPGKLNPEPWSLLRWHLVR